MPQGLGELSLHFRTINLQFFPVTALPRLEGSLGTAVPGFDYGYLLETLENTGEGSCGNNYSKLKGGKMKRKREKKKKHVCDQLGLWWVRAELKRKSHFPKGTQTSL